MQNDRDRQSRQYDNYYHERDYSNGSFPSSRNWFDHDNDYGSNRNYRSDRNYGGNERDRYYTDKPDREFTGSREYVERINRGMNQYSDRSHDNRRGYESRGYEGGYNNDYDYNSNRQYNRDFESNRSYGDQYRERDNDRYSRDNAYSVDRIDYRQNYDRDRDFEADRGYGRNRDLYDDGRRNYARDYDYDREQSYGQQEPRSIKDKYSSSSLHYSGITSIGEGDERNRDRYEGSRYIGNQRSDRRFAGSGMGSSQRYRY